MVGLIGNLAPWELVVIAVVAVIVFGRRLPEVAGRVFAELRRLRGSMEKLRRETGIDHELRSIERSVRDVARESSIERLPRSPAEERVPRQEVRPSGVTESAPPDRGDAPEPETPAPRPLVSKKDPAPESEDPG